MNGWKITGKQGAAQCEHCGRGLSFTWIIRHESGQEMKVGRGCIKTVTGWTVSAKQAEAALKCAAMDAKWAEFEAAHPETAAGILADKVLYQEHRLAARTGNWGFALSYNQPLPR